MKRFLAGFLTCALLLTGTTVYADGISKTINAVFGQVKLVVDGKTVDKETLLYNGTTYVPLRAAAEALGKEVDYDAETHTAYIGVKPVQTQPQVQSKEPIELTGASLVYEYGLPVLYLAYKNNTPDDIIRFDLYIYGMNAYEKDIADFNKSYYSQNKLLGNSEGDTKFTLTGLSGIYYAVLGVFKYQTADGKTVEIPENNIEWYKIEKE